MVGIEIRGSAPDLENESHIDGSRSTKLRHRAADLDLDVLRKYFGLAWLTWGCFELDATHAIQNGTPGKPD
ncbi:uncharacterized protein PgNI_11744 [Pyricularia grisea]|uniref:Uncharacterized protein n=1 Tax=Pyricularia grisea TaxID=148305 RepID=A0A6P8AP14_PYRGI|nr:uncharacterized protein PgNI_11744 [Pyricularia grisea]TLD03775.1 hypothetical protein PgNI_11744 [Pyricularia grisea]